MHMYVCIYVCARIYDDDDDHNHDHDDDDNGDGDDNDDEHDDDNGDALQLTMAMDTCASGPLWFWTPVPMGPLCL